MWPKSLWGISPVENAAQDKPGVDPVEQLYNVLFGVETAAVPERHQTTTTPASTDVVPTPQPPRPNTGTESKGHGPDPVSFVHANNLVMQPQRRVYGSPGLVELETSIGRVNSALHCRVCVRNPCFRPCVTICGHMFCERYVMSLVCDIYSQMFSSQLYHAAVCDKGMLPCLRKGVCSLVENVICLLCRVPFRALCIMYVICTCAYIGMITIVILTQRIPGDEVL